MDDKYRVIYYFGNTFYRSWVDSTDEAFLSAIDQGCVGITITWLTNDNAPSCWRYFLMKGDIQGVSRKTFFTSIGTPNFC